MISAEEAQAIAAALAAEVDKSSATFGIRDVLLLVGLEVIAMISVLFLLGWFVLRYVMKKQSVAIGRGADPALADRAHSIVIEEGSDAFKVINRTDEFGMPILYGMAQAAKDIAKSVLSLDEKMTHLFNHQSQLWKTHDEDIKKLKQQEAIRRRQSMK